jgi:type VI secretion system ImpA family protein
MLQWLNEKLSVQLTLLPLTAPPENSDVPAVSLADIEAARHRSHAARQPGAPANPKEPQDAGLARSLSLTPRDHLAQAWTDLHRALDVVQALGAALDRYYGQSNGGFLRITGALAEMIAAISPGLPADWQVFSQPPSQPEPQPTPAVVQTMNAVAEQAIHRDPKQGIQTREEAYALLAEIANFLARIEPHSPVPYLLQRAIAWGGMSLQELLPELLNDQSALKDVGHLLRLQANGSASTNQT